MPKLILVVEDDADITANMKTFLEDEGFEVSTAKHGGFALACLDSGLRPDLIVLDLMMPIMDGWEFRRRQLEHETYRSIPVMVATASGIDQRSIDVQTVVRKPIDLDVFLEAIQRVCAAKH